MELVSKNAQAILESEIEEYRNRILDRASYYMYHDGDSLIHEKQIKMAIRALGNPEAVRSYNSEIKRKRMRRLQISTALLLLCMLIWLLICIIYLSNGTYDKMVFIVGIAGSIASMAILLYSILKIKRPKHFAKSPQVVEFLGEWNRFEGLLRYAYKGANKGGNISFSDLLDFYLSNYSKDKLSDQRRIISALRIRNNILHREINQVDEKMLDRHVNELQDLIAKMKR